MMPVLGFYLSGICWIFTFAHHYSTTVLSYIICVAHVHYQKPPCCLSCTRSLGNRSIRRVFCPPLNWWCRVCGHRVVYCRPGFRFWYPLWTRLGSGFWGWLWPLPCQLGWLGINPVQQMLHAVSHAVCFSGGFPSKHFLAIVYYLRLKGAIFDHNT